MARRLALLVATYNYQDSGLRRLTAPANDAEALAAVLRDPDISGFEVTTLVNEPHYRVGETIGEFYRNRRHDDLTLLYFTGHGLKDDNGRLYLAMTNTLRDSLLFTSLSAEQIDYAMEGCSSRQKVLILDCCYSGAFPAGKIAKADPEVHAIERFQGKGRTVLTASDATQYSFEGGELLGEASQSLFTRYLVEGLKTGLADLDGDGDISLEELYNYVHGRVVEEMPRQRPKRHDSVEGRIIIARNVSWSLPAYLSSALESPIAASRLGALEGLEHLYRIGNDVVRSCVKDEIRCLVDDDSRMVSAAAERRLRSLFPNHAEHQPDVLSGGLSTGEDARGAEAPRVLAGERTPSGSITTAAPVGPHTPSTREPLVQPPPVVDNTVSRSTDPPIHRLSVGVRWSSTSVSTIASAILLSSSLLLMALWWLGVTVNFHYLWIWLLLASATGGVVATFFERGDGHFWAQGLTIVSTWCLLFSISFLVLGALASGALALRVLVYGVLLCLGVLANGFVFTIFSIRAINENLIRSNLGSSRLFLLVWSAVAVVAFGLAALGYFFDAGDLFSAGGWTLLVADLILLGSIVEVKTEILRGRGQQEK